MNLNSIGAPWHSVISGPSPKTGGAEEDWRGPGKTEEAEENGDANLANSTYSQEKPAK